MKHLILLLAIVAVSCNTREPKTHSPKWYWLCQDSTGGMAVDTSLCSIDSVIGDTTFIRSKSDGSVILTKIRQGPNNGYNFKDMKFYSGRTTDKLPQLFRDYYGRVIWRIPADTSYIEFWGKRFYPAVDTNFVNLNHY